MRYDSPYNVLFEGNVAKFVFLTILAPLLVASRRALEYRRRGDHCNWSRRVQELLLSSSNRAAKSLGPPSFLPTVGRCQGLNRENRRNKK